MANAYKRIAASRPANTDEAELYEVPASTEVVGRVYICNQDTEARTFNLAHTVATGTAAVEDWIAYTQQIAVGGTISYNVTMGAAETIRVQASAVDVISFILEGLVIT